MVEKYGSDVSREQFEIIREDLEKAKKATRPRKVVLYDIFCAVLYILKTGCQWRNLPKDFPNWKLVYYYFTIWKKPKESGKSLLEEILKKISTKNSNCRREEGKNKFCDY
jgi:transposase